MPSTKSRGTASSNGVNYCYQLTASDWFGTYELRFHEYYFQGQVSEIRTSPFRVGEYTWELEIKLEKEFLGAYLILKSEESVDIHHSYRLRNLQRRKQSQHHVCRDTFFPNAARGFQRLVEVKAIKEASSGFRHGDAIAIEVGIRIVTPLNETFTVDTEDNKWKLRSERKIFVDHINSKTFAIGNTEWNLLLLPKSKQGKRVLGFYLVARDRTEDEVTMLMKAWSSLPQSKDKHREERHVFSLIGTNDWGWSDFLTEKEVLDPSLGFVVDGCEDSETCVVCMDGPRTSGVLHGVTSHRCYCLKCAKRMAKIKRLRCPLCRGKVERVIEKFF